MFFLSLFPTALKRNAIVRKYSDYGGKTFINYHSHYFMQCHVILDRSERLAHIYIIDHVSHDYDLASHTICVVCINFIHVRSLKSTPNDKFLRKFSWQF